MTSDRLTPGAGPEGKLSLSNREGRVALRGIVSLSKIDEKDPEKETYWTGMMEVSAVDETGRTIFESFHLFAAPVTEPETFARLKVQIKESSSYELEQSLRTLHGKN